MPLLSSPPTPTLMDFIYLAFPGMPDDSYYRKFRCLLLVSSHACDVHWVPFTPFIDFCNTCCVVFILSVYNYKMYKRIWNIDTQMQSDVNRLENSKKGSWQQQVCHSKLRTFTHHITVTHCFYVTEFTPLQFICDNWFSKFYHRMWLHPFFFHSHVYVHRQTDRQTDRQTHTHTQTHTQAYRLSVSKMQMFLEYKYYNASINHFYLALKAFSKKHQRVAIVLTWNQTNHSTGLNLPLY